jgi:hypothetical protein
VQVHQNLVYRGRANGKTFTDNESFTMFANPQTGVQKFAGTLLNIQIPGHGNVLKDAGVLVADFSTNPPTVLHQGGKHPLFHNGFRALRLPGELNEHRSRARRGSETRPGITMRRDGDRIRRSRPA